MVMKYKYYLLIVLSALTLFSDGAIRKSW